MEFHHPFGKAMPLRSYDDASGAGPTFARHAIGAVMVMATLGFHSAAEASIAYGGSASVSNINFSGNRVYAPGAMPVLNVPLSHYSNAGLKVSQY